MTNHQHEQATLEAFAGHLWIDGADLDAWLADGYRLASVPYAQYAARFENPLDHLVAVEVGGRAAVADMHERLIWLTALSPDDPGFDNDDLSKWVLEPREVAARLAGMVLCWQER